MNNLLGLILFILSNPTNISYFLKSQKQLNNMLLHACKDNNIQEAQILLDRGADVNAPGKSDFTALHHAINKREEVELVSLLLSRGADANAKNKSKCTPLHFAVSDSSFRITKLLLDAGADTTIKNKNDHSALNIAISDKSDSIVELCKRYDLIKHSNNMAFLASLADDEQPEDVKHAKLWLAATKIQARTRGCQFRQQKQRKLNLMLLQGCLGNNEETVQSLIKQGADIKTTNDEKSTALLCAVNNNKASLNIVKMLVNAGVNVNAQNKDGNTPLHLAAINDLDQIIMFLMGRGADISIKNSNNATAMVCACQSQAFKVIPLLTDKDKAEEIKNLPNYYSNSMYAQAMKILQNELGADFTQVIRYDASTNCIVVGSSVPQGKYYVYDFKQQQQLVSGMTSEQVKEYRAKQINA